MVGELTIEFGKAPPIKGKGTMNTSSMVVDSNGNMTTKTMVELTVNGERMFKYLDAEETAFILMALGVMDYGEF